MTHSQQPSIDIICKQLVDEKTSEVLQKILNEIYSAPKEPTADELLDDMMEVRNFSLNRDRLRKHWYAKGYTENGVSRITDGKTPREALFALREKLTSNK